LYTEATGEISMPSVFDVTSTSAGEMFLGALVPGLLLVGLYMLFILGFAFLRPQMAPSVPYEGERGSRFWGKVAITLIPPLTLIFLVLGSIIGGIATVNQAGAIGAAGALIMAGYRLTEGQPRSFYPALLAIISLGAIGFAIANYDMNVKAIDSAEDVTGIYIGVAGAVLLVVALIWSGLRALRIQNTLNGVMVETAKTTSLVFVILLGAAMLTAAFRAFGGEELVRDFLTGLPGGFWTQFIIVMLVIFILGFFLDFIEIAVVVVPIVAPILLSDPGANITAVWLGVMIGLNIQTSFLTPPFGFALFYLRGVAPAVVKTVQMYKGVVAFIGLQLTALVIVGLYPQLVNYLPNRTSLLSETAPPPRNPGLQYCLMDYVNDQLQAENGGSTLDAIARARTLDLSALPRSLGRDLEKSFDQAETAVNAVGEVFEAKRIEDEAAVAYRPIRADVRRFERDIRKLDEKIEDAEVTLRRGNGSEEFLSRLEERRAAWDAEREALRAQIPETWPETYETFHALVKAENDARTSYARNADDAWEVTAFTVATLEANDAFAAARADLDAVRGIIEGSTAETAEAAQDQIRVTEDLFEEIAGAEDVEKALGKARRALRPNRFDQAKALDEYADAVEAYEEQVDWRAAAAPLLPDLKAYAEGIREVVGLRQQDRFTRE
ncbi:MAG: TRAP transporter large permease subunit, partial [Pseudomonadota bacterium]